MSSPGTMARIRDWPAMRSRLSWAVILSILLLGIFGYAFAINAG